MEIDVADDGRVFYIERNGQVRLIETTGAVRTVLNLSVTTVQEFGLVGIALDPDFTTNGWVYLYWSPAGSAVDKVSRFTMGATSIDPATEEVVLEVPVQREQCCHAGGALEFDAEGNLYIATGDNTNPFESQGYTPTDERAGRAAFDAQRTSGNTNSLSGKVLRITPQDDGSYTIPTGNLFAPGTALTRPEIYGMGFRNPFRIGIDPLTDKLMVADYGPDAGATSATRGPDGRVEWQVLIEPGNYGWPYCHAGNTPYVDWNFATQHRQRAVQLQQPGQQLPEQHRPHPAAPGHRRADLVRPRVDVQLPGHRHRRRARWRARRTSTTPSWTPTPSGRSTSRTRPCSASGTPASCTTCC